jgi:hypothetical protein
VASPNTVKAVKLSEVGPIKKKKKKLNSIPYKCHLHFITLLNHAIFTD